MRTLLLGYTGPEVVALQSRLGVTADGHYGPITQAAVMQHQRSVGLRPSGSADQAFWGSLGETAVPPSSSSPPTRTTGSTRSPSAKVSRQPWAKVNVHKHRKGYARLTLRQETADQLRRIKAVIEPMGAVLTSSGGRRSLAASSSPNRSPTSLHYTGRALDLYLYGGMVDPVSDPHVITLDDEDAGLWRVWARCRLDQGQHKLLDAWTYKGRRDTVKVSGDFIDLTAIMAEHGFDRIPSRRRFITNRRSSQGGAEWWHFQDERGLTKGVSTFGDELSVMWSPSQLRGTRPWKLRHYTWTGHGFAK